MIEAKFWAGLTDRQRVHYLRRLEHNRALLLFVAPAQRLESLWPELERRVTGANLPMVVMTPALPRFMPSASTQLVYSR
jgi:hypothetical protein